MKEKNDEFRQAVETAMPAMDFEWVRDDAAGEWSLRLLGWKDPSALRF